ncbi:hypothetical protein L6164_020717 [Bauhinia variegata]|uniref:Uncharacterized protein n=1 Tax=Bauhinia variegata TaxID=167791 RepID=A0ACB9MY08_BAUVA|nr:hypothetical protein L6164_020717 [Bauhinia variegata]
MEKSNHEVFISFRDPSIVRHQTGSYADAFSKHEQRWKDNLQKVQTWRAALAEAANLSGWDCSVHRMESDLVEKIANDVLKKLQGVGGDDDLEGEIAMCKRMAQRHEEMYLRTRDVSHWNAYNATHQRIAQLQQQLMVRLRDQSLGHTT